MLDARAAAAAHWMGLQTMVCGTRPGSSEYRTGRSTGCRVKMDGGSQSMSGCGCSVRVRLGHTIAVEPENQSAENHATPTVMISEPRKPSHVLLGEMARNGLLNTLRPAASPQKYAQQSF